MDYYRPGEGVQMMVFCAQQDIETIERENENLRLKVEELEEKNRRLEEARENANEACAKWERLYRAAKIQHEVFEKMVKEYQEVIIPGYRNIAEKSGGIPMPEPPKEV